MAIPYIRTLVIALRSVGSDSLKSPRCEDARTRPPPGGVLTNNAARPTRPRGYFKPMSQVDEELAKVASSSLWIGTKDVTKCDASAYSLTSYDTRHQGFYSYSLRDMMVPVKQVDKGVPGFPDFPAFWTGEEGGARTNKKLRKSNKARERKVRRMLRREVNSIPHKGNVSCKFDSLAAKREQKRARREKRMQRIELKRKRRKDMADISHGIASLKC